MGKQSFFSVITAVAALVVMSCSDDTTIRSGGTLSEDKVECGNGVVESGEVCDDDNVDSNDGCSNDCSKVEDGYKCPEKGGVCTKISGDEPGGGDEPENKAECGNGKLEGEEKCDDGNLDNGDGCDNTCVIEPGYYCKTIGEKSDCSNIKCGNGQIDELEECDDDNRVSGDGCSALCFVETGYRCSQNDKNISVCENLCGNGNLDTNVGEQCDDHNQTSGDGCTMNCLLEPGYMVNDEGMIVSRACGDGILAGSEQCDDGNRDSGDGCSRYCRIEPNYHCPDAGKLCVADKCGDGVLTGDETCDTGSADSTGCVDCRTQIGFKCLTPGMPCETTSCGDGVLEGAETCEDSENTKCCVGCVLQTGCTCNTEGKACQFGGCGNGVVEYGEECDDGNHDAGDGCSPVCEIENIYDCNEFGCKPKCGDGLVLEGVEECDDGNLTNGDGCSSTCKSEQGFECKVKWSGTPDVLPLPIIYHDFIRYSGHSASSGTDGYVSQELYDSLPDDCKRGGVGATYRYLSSDTGYDLAVGRPSPDFLSYCPASHCEGAVKEHLGTDGMPDLAPVSSIHCPDSTQEVDCRYLYTCPAVFKWWYNDVPNLNKRIESTLTFQKVSGTTNDYVYENGEFWPLSNDDGYGFAGSEGTGNGEFSSHFQTYFKYEGGEKLDFNGDDDVWVFFNGILGVDVGGIHPQWNRNITLDTDTAASKFHMYPGGIYALDMFHAERCRGGSSYKMTLSGFVSLGSSQCDAICGDGMIRGDEECDIKGHINDDVSAKAGCVKCRNQAYCGNDKIEEGEECDGGESGVDWCDPVTCKLSAGTCGNGSLDAHEQCDYAITDPSVEGYAVSCLKTCRLPACGDGVVSDDEECDDGNSSNDDACTTACKRPKCGDGVVTPSIGEACDDGINDGTYGHCGINCVYEAPKCGDGVIDELHGEECDDGAYNQDNTYGVCSTKCKLGERCGDGILQPDFEECEDLLSSGCYHCIYPVY